MQIITITYRSTNYYVLDNGGCKLLVDGGWPGTMGEFKHAFQRKDIDLGKIDYLLATHYHPDHAGLAQDIKEMGIKLIVIYEQTAFVPKLKEYIKTGTPYKEIKLNDNVVIAVENSRNFLKKLGFDGEIVHTPGHSADSITLVLDTGEAFTGDLPPNYFNTDAGDLVNKSWMTLKKIGINKIYPGHGTPVVL